MSRIYFFVISSLSIVAITLATLSYQKSLTINLPTLYVLQRKYNQTSDRIIRTDGLLNSPETIFESADIQLFSVVNNKMIVATGKKLTNSNLQLVDLVKKKVESIESPEGYITEMVSGGEKVVFALDKIVDGFPERKSILNIFSVATKQFTQPKVQNFAVSVSNLHLSGDNQLLLFSGFGSYHYVVDMDNFESVTKIQTKMNYSTGFDYTNKKILAAGFYSKDFKLVDVNNGIETAYSLPTDSFKDIVLARAGSDIYFSIKNAPANDYKSKIFKFGKLGNSDLIKSEIFSYELPKIDKSDRFIALESYSKVDLEKTEDFRVAGLQVRPPSATIVVFDTKTQQLINTGLKGIDVAWAE
jgi:hypothetical protein